MSQKGNDIFIDVNSIRAGEKWNIVIEENISNCDLFIVIVTPAALESEYVEREIAQLKEKIRKLFHAFILLYRMKMQN